jgi:hypothetical protein
MGKVPSSRSAFADLLGPEFPDSAWRLLRSAAAAHSSQIQALNFSHSV